MATEEINYRVDTKPAHEGWTPWAFAYDDLALAKQKQIAALKHSHATVRDARIVEIRRTVTETVLAVDAASLTVLSREEI